MNRYIHRTNPDVSPVPYPLSRIHKAFPGRWMFFWFRNVVRGMWCRLLEWRTPPLLGPAGFAGLRVVAGLGIYLTQSVFQVVLQQSIPTMTRQRILYISDSKE